VTESFDTPEAIRALRKRLGLSQMDFAVRVGVTTDTVNGWEAGRRHPSKLARRRLAEFVAGLPPDEGD
jgi:putative transcriptional regulator